MPTCTSGRHIGSDEASAIRCCNGWHRELRLEGPEPSDDPQGRVHVSDLADAPRAVFVWVKDEEPSQGGS